ncbi:MAG: ATP-binding cassette domain-containing protein [Clostridia bacterium]
MISTSPLKGKILTLIGPNGSGKSTILKPSSSSCQRFAGRSISMAWIWMR